MDARTCTAFAGQRRIAQGAPLEVALQVKAHLKRDVEAAVLVFDDDTGKPVELDLRGSARTLARRYGGDEPPSVDSKPGPGRPKLGVVAREVTLLPRHWDWLAGQPGGASVTLRKLVEEARSKNRGKDQRRRAQEATHHFMTAMAGDLPGYEEALRALYTGKLDAIAQRIARWPRDIREHVLKLAAKATAQTP